MDTSTKVRICQEDKTKNKKQKQLKIKKLSKTLAKQRKFPIRKLHCETVKFESDSDDCTVDLDSYSDESLHVGNVEVEI